MAMFFFGPSLKTNQVEKWLLPKGHAKFQANPRIRSRVKSRFTVPIRMQCAICRYFGHKIIRISLNFIYQHFDSTVGFASKNFSRTNKKKSKKIKIFFLCVFKMAAAAIFFFGPSLKTISPCNDLYPRLWRGGHPRTRESTNRSGC